MKPQSDASVISPYLQDLLQLLWPAPRTTALSESSHLSFVLIPNLRDPKLVIPRRPWAASAAALRNYRASATGRGMLVIRAVALGARLGFLNFLPSRLTVRSSDDSIDAYLSQVLATRVSIAMYIGPQRAIQKPVLQVLDANGRTVAFAKLAINELTASLIRREAEAIGQLSEHNLRHLDTPRIISQCKWRGTDLIVQSAIAPGGSDARLKRLLPEATRELANSSRVPERRWMQSGYRADLYKNILHHRSSPHAEYLLQLLDGLDVELAEDVVPFGSWHGDWAPWNMTSTETQVVAWDWEHFDTGVPIGLDAVHFDLAEQLFEGGTSVIDAYAGVLEGRRGDLTTYFTSDIGRPQLVTLYVLELVTRYLERGEDLVGGTSLSRVGEWLPEVVARCRIALHSRV